MRLMVLAGVLVALAGSVQGHEGLPVAWCSGLRSELTEREAAARRDYDEAFAGYGGAQFGAGIEGCRLEAADPALAFMMDERMRMAGKVSDARILWKATLMMLGAARQECRESPPLPLPAQ